MQEEMERKKAEERRKKEEEERKRKAEEEEKKKFVFEFAISYLPLCYVIAMVQTTAQTAVTRRLIPCQPVVLCSVC